MTITEISNEKISKINPIYKALNIDKLKNCNLIYTPNSKNKNGYSEHSLQFDVDCIKDVFNLNCKSFCAKYTEAISGLEKSNIFTLHSSSLLALLFFHNVSEDCPIEIKGVTYNNVEFEHKNSITYNNKKNKTNSYIDITLYDGDTLEKSKNVLFLESKFSEYISNTGPVSKISKAAYNDVYKELKDVLEHMKLKCTFDSNYGRLEGTDGNKHYCGGIKQMICHYLGVKEYAELRNDENFMKSRNLSIQNISLGSVLFKFPEEIDTDDLFGDYEDLHKQLMQSFKTENNVVYLCEPMTYQELAKKRINYLEDSIKSFYRL